MGMIKNFFRRAGWMGGMAFLIAGCSQVGIETSYTGVRVPSALVDQAEKEAESCFLLSKKLRAADFLESLRFLRKGAELRDGDCCIQYLLIAEGPDANLAQRLYARLFLESLLEKGAIRTSAGADVTLDLYNQLCWAWRCTEPRSPMKAQQALEAMRALGLTPELARSEFISRMIAEGGVQADVRIERTPWRMQATGMNSGWLKMASNAQYDAIASGRSTADAWAVLGGTAWGGGSEKLLIATSVLAFLVNDQGEPSFRGRFLWLRNCGTASVYYSSTTTGHANQELGPGMEALQPVDRHSLDENQVTTGIPIMIRFRPAH
jgi:hypothetical protein